MVGLGLGLGLGMSGNRGGPSPSAEDAVKAAIKERHHIRAKRGGVSVLIQPYALLRVEGVSVLKGVEVFVEGEARGEWSPSDLPMGDLADVEIYNETFVPSDAFDASALDGVVAVVEPFDPFKDASEGAPGEN